MQVKVRTPERGLSIDSSPTAHSVRNGSPNAKSRREDLTTPDLRIVRFAVASRVTVIALSVLSDWIIPDHNPDPSVERRLSTSRWLRAFTRWDAARFTTIALEGYQKEEDYAFMPVLPMAMSIGTRVLGILVPHIGPSATVAVGVVITNCCFVLAAWLLYRLGLLVLRDQLLAFRSAMVFCFSPSNVFFSSVYTESPFAACSFGGLLLLELNRPWLGALLFGIGTGLRSNGILNAGFLAYQCLYIIVQDLQRGHTLLRTLLERSRKHAALMLGVALSVGPFVVFQAYAWQKECYAGDSCAEAGQCKLSEQPPDWCQGSMPSIYMHVQKKYWQGGLFCYWQLKQIPNFALAAPALALTASGVHHILTDFGRQLGRWTEVSCESKPTPRAGAALCRAVLVCPLLPHALHWGFLAAYLLLCANVQIATRVLGSGCPVFHWFLASLLFSRSPGKTSRLLKCYIGIFNCLGIIMHPNFLPWT